MPSIKSYSLAAVFTLGTLVPMAALAGPATPAPPLPPPVGATVLVSTEAQLQSAVSGLSSNTTIVVAPGTYTLTGPLYINGTFTNVGIRGATNNRDDVVLAGAGMNDASVPYGIWVGGNVQGVTIANLTIRDIYYHPIILNAGTQSPLIHNVRLLNAGQQFIKSNATGSGTGVNNGIVRYSIIEYATTSRDDYTNGVDVHTGTGWAIRHNLFRNVRSPVGLAGPAILMWNGSSNTTVEGNTFIDCQREISMGLIDRAGATDHSGGIVQNNFIFRSASVSGDTAILIADSPNTKVVNNSILVSGGYSSPIEYRFAGTTGIVIANNLLDGDVTARDGATGTVTNNYTSAAAGLFVSPAAGDLHLKPTASVAIDKGSATFAPAVDWDGRPRPFGLAVDIGADEFRTIVSNPPAPPKNLRIIR